MKVLLSAYACEPGRGSEPEAGFRTLLAAAGRHEVWVITRANNVAALNDALADQPHRDRIHIVGLDLGRLGLKMKRWGWIGLQWYYDRWQAAAGRAAARLHEEVGFDVAHHVTFAAYWSRVGVRGLGIPLVVGPVGGGVRTPRGLWPVLGIRGMAEEALRTIGRASIASVISARATMHSAQVVLVQNQETANLLAPLADAVVLPNALSLEAGKEIPDRSEGGREIAFVGRLIAWKAAVLAVRTMGLLDDESISLHIYGEGPEKRRVVRAARRWGVADRVIFEGWLERDVLRSRLARAASLLHPALHEEAGFAVAEALAAGTPVVCLDHGGPAELIRRWSDARSQAIPPTRPRATAQAMSDAVCKVIRGGANGSEGEPPRLDYVATVLGAYERARG